VHEAHPQREEDIRIHEFQLSSEGGGAAPQMREGDQLDFLSFSF
jgi:hypothetical protein